MLRPRPSHTAIAVGAAATVIGSLPTLLTGALAPQLTVALSFGTAGLGVVFAVQSGVAAIASIPLGSVVDRLGASRSLRLAMATTALISLWIALAVNSFAIFVVLLTLMGAVKRVIEPAANRLLINRVRPPRLGLAFGMKQSAPPASAMLAGLSVPLIAVAWGWQGPYVLAAALATILAVAVRRHRPVAPSGAVSTDQAASEREAAFASDRPTLAVLSIAFGLANGASITITAFYVSGAVAAGASSEAAGTLLALGSIAAIVARLILGVIADRLVGSHLRVCSGLLAAGAVGLALLASGDPRLGAGGVLLALTGTWGFNGLFWFAMVRANPSAPGGIIGKIAPGALVAGSLSPLAFGLVAERHGYGYGWTISSTMAVLAAVGMLMGQRRLLRLGIT